MKIIVCGAGVVGTGIARQLASEENDVTVIDSIPENIRQVRETLDCKAYLGFPAHPTTLEEAGIAGAEMIIAVTTSDEVNMVICQVAHSLFNVPLKIARIRHQSYLLDQWKDLYRHDHISIDHIISPEKEVANAIISRLHVPGAMDSLELAEGRIRVIEVRIGRDCPVIGQPISHVQELLSGVTMAVIAINRNEELIFPAPTESLRMDDELFFVADSEHVLQVMAVLGHQEREARRVLIVGGGNIGLFIADSLEQEGHGINAKIIELDRTRAEFAAGRLTTTAVINGSALDQEILMEAAIESTETVIAVTNDDEVNILAALLAKRFGAQRAFALINKGRSYNALISSLGVDVTVNPREMTVSSILQHTRRGKVRAAYTICNGLAEVLETEAVAQSAVAGKHVRDLNLPKGVAIVAIYRDGEVSIPTADTAITEHDRIVVLSLVSQLRKVDKIFSARVDYF